MMYNNSVVNRLHSQSLRMNVVNYQGVNCVAAKHHNNIGKYPQHRQKHLTLLDKSFCITNGVIALSF